MEERTSQLFKSIESFEHLLIENENCKSPPPLFTLCFLVVAFVWSTVPSKSVLEGVRVLL